MPLTRRWTPEHHPDEVVAFGIDFSDVIPKGVVIAGAQMDIWTNTPGNAHDANADWKNVTPGPVPPASVSPGGAVYIRGRSVFAVLSGGVLGTDYKIAFGANDSRGNTWVRHGLILVAESS